MTPRQKQQRGRWLNAALQNGRVARAAELILQGADLAVRTAEGATPLYTALAYGHYCLVPLLLEQGADPNVPGDFGSYPLHLAAEWGGDHASALLEALLRHGAAIDARDEEGATAIFLAGKTEGPEAIRTLLRHGANISDRNRELDTALTFACCWGRTERAELLLEAGIDLHARDDGGMDALCWAARGGHTETIALLLRWGAEVNVADRWGQTPLIYAAEHGSARSVSLLLQAGADPAARDAEGQTALDHARRYAGRDLAEALQELAAGCRGGGSETLLETVTLERSTSPAGEPSVEIVGRLGGGGWSITRIDEFDRVIELLEADEANVRKMANETVTTTG